MAAQKAGGRFLPTPRREVEGWIAR